MSSSLSKINSSTSNNAIINNLQSVPLELLIVDQDMAKELQCAICLQILNSPRQCKNGHLFCHECIFMSMKKSSECPQCRCLLSYETLSRSIFVEKHLRILNNSGGWVRDEEGCNMIMSLETSAKHELTCENRFESCKYSKDCDLLRFKNLEDHHQQCGYRPIQCPHCNNDFTFIESKNHIHNCDMMEIECDKCNISLKKKEMEKHKSDHCPNCTIQCPFSEYGCSETFDRSLLKNHLNESLAQHFIYMRDHQNTTIENLKKEFNESIHQKDEKIKSLEKTIKEKLESGTKIEWRVKNYSQLRKKGYVQSEKFSIGGFTYFIGFYIDGDTNDSKGFVSIYLFLDTLQLPKGKSVNIEYYLKFCNQRDVNNSVKKNFCSTFPIKGGQGWGDRKAIRTSLLEANGFVKDDTLLIKAEIVVKRVFWLLEEHD
eukprot:gene10786-13207_t